MVLHAIPDHLLAVTLMAGFAQIIRGCPGPLPALVWKDTAVLPTTASPHLRETVSREASENLLDHPRKGVPFLVSVVSLERL
jgi:hypothetical protein